MRPGVESLEPRTLLNAGPIISEFLADNHRGLEDFDDDRPDWIELANPTSTPIDLAGYYLTDDPQDLRKWQVPVETVLEAGTQLVVFASGKDFVAPNGELHTNFKLSRDGEFLALVQPDGTTIAWQFAARLPGGDFGFPQQFEDISYGVAGDSQRLALVASEERFDIDRLLYFPIPTPGAGNIEGAPLVAAPPDFSVAGGPFTDDFLLRLRTDLPDGEIRFTLDGAAPTLNSPVAHPDVPVSITGSTQVRAMVVAPGHLPSPVRTESYLKLAADLQDFTSPLPLVVLENFGDLQFPPSFQSAAYWAIFQPHGDDGRSSLTAAPDLQTRAGVRLRGSSTLAFPKKSYAVEAWDEKDHDQDVSPLGLPAESDWILNGRYKFDRALIRNAAIYELSNQTGRYAVRTRFVEVFVNIDGGDLARNDYVGVYTLMEKIKRGPDRVDVAELAKNYNTEPLITGGYMFKIDRVDPNDTGFVVDGQTWLYVDPEESEIEQPVRQPQRQYIQDYLADVGASIGDPDPQTGYPTLIDVDSWIDHHLLNILAKNPDAFRLSTYLFKPRGGLLQYGPIWDFDRTMGNDDDARAADPTGWEPGIPYHFTGTSEAPATFWWRTLLEDPDFRQRYIDRYQQLRAGPWSTENVNALIATLAGQLTEEAATRNFNKWVFIPPNSGDPPSWLGEVEHLRNWLQERLAWIDEQLIDKPILTADAAAGDGFVPAGTTVTISLPPGAAPATQVFYTLDGTDPRTPSYALELPDNWSLLRDFNASEDGTFLIDLPNGSYDVTLEQGDLQNRRDAMNVFLEGTLVATLGAEAGDFLSNTYRVDVTDGQLAVRIEDAGGLTPRAVLNGLEIAPVAAAAGQQVALDFGTAGSPVAAGYRGAGDDLFDSERGYGWTSGALRRRDRGEANDLRRDFVAVTSETASFAVDMPDGIYGVTVVMGDAANVRDQMRLELEPGETGEVVDEITVAAGQFHESTYVVRVTGGQLNLQLADLGGATARAVINGLVVAPVIRFDFGTGTSPVQFGHAGVTEHTLYTAALGHGWVAGSIDSVERIAAATYGAVSDTAIQYRGEAIPVTGPTTIRARAFLPDSPKQFVLDTQPIDWSGEQQVSLNTGAGRLVLTEMNYHPADPTPAEQQQRAELSGTDFEFIELQNIGSAPIRLGGYAFTDGIDFVFADTSLQPGQHGVLVRDRDAFEVRYGTDAVILGQYDGKLSNGGERLVLVDAAGRTVFDFEYGDDDPWPVRADGSGATLDLLDPPATPPDEYGKYYRWRGSTEAGGSPGRPGAEPPGVVINEVVSRGTPDGAVPDAIELVNTTNSSVDIGGWYVSDSAAYLLKYRIPDGTTIDPAGYVVFDERQFNPTPATPGPNDFGLSGTDGDDVWLVQADAAGNVIRFVDDVHFGAAAVGQSFGRVPDGTGRLGPVEAVTLGRANAPARVGPVVISELHYHPAPPAEEARSIFPNLDDNDLEFVEITNPTPDPVDLAGWTLAGGIRMEFPAGTKLGAGESLVVVSFDPKLLANQQRLAAFRANYALPESVPLLGGYTGRLADGGEKVQLLRVDVAAARAAAAPVLVQEDEVLYDNLPPWPTEPDGGGLSLQRQGLAAAGHLAESWRAGQPSPGIADLIFAGDADGDGDVDFDDIDDLVLAITDADAFEARFGVSVLVAADVNRDGRIDNDDIAAFVAVLRARP